MFGCSTCRTCRTPEEREADTVKVSLDEPLCEELGKVPEVASSKCLKLGDDAWTGEVVVLHEVDKAQELVRLLQLREEMRKRDVVQALPVEGVVQPPSLDAEKQRAKHEELRQRFLEEQEEQSRRAHLLAEEGSKHEQLKRWLSKNGFAGVNQRRKKAGLLTSHSSYPLHVAVKANDVTVLRLLLWGGAGTCVIDSSDFTPLELAQKLDRNGSHRQVINALRDANVK